MGQRLIEQIYDMAMRSNVVAVGQCQEKRALQLQRTCPVGACANGCNGNIDTTQFLKVNTIIERQQSRLQRRLQRCNR